MNSAASDPYYVARDAVNQSVSEIQTSVKKWETYLASDTFQSRVFTDSTRILLEDVDRLEEDLAIIDSSIRVVETNPSRFPLRAGELDLRKQWASMQHRICVEIRGKVNGPQAKAKIESDKRKAASAASEQARAKKTVEDSADHTIGSSKQVHEQIIAQQDETLTELARVTDRLGETAVVINSELQDQQRLLSQLDNDMDRQQEKMNYVMGKMGKLLKTSDMKQIGFVIFLLLLSIVLFMWNIS